MTSLEGARQAGTAAMGARHILVIADEEATVRIVAAQFATEEGFKLSTSSGLESGLRQIQTEWPALIILDLIDRERAFELCRCVKADRGTMGIPIIIVAPAKDAADRVAGLELGVDDYVEKPFNARELILRAKAVLRRKHRPRRDEQLVLGPIRLDPARCEVAVDQRLLQLTAVEFKLLRVLVRDPGLVHSREALRTEARGAGELLESRTIDTHIRRLRQKMGEAAHFVETVRGSGYRLRPA